MTREEAEALVKHWKIFELCHRQVIDIYVQHCLIFS